MFSMTEWLQRVRNPRLLVLLLGDWLALALFVFIGQADHELLGVQRLLLTTAGLALPWTIAAGLLGAYTLPVKSGGAFFGRSLLAWLVAAPLALLLRAYLNGQATIVVIFMTITLGLGGVFLLLWRALYYFLIVRRRERQHAALAEASDWGAKA